MSKSFILAIGGAIALGLTLFGQTTSEKPYRWSITAAGVSAVYEGNLPNGVLLPLCPAQESQLPPEFAQIA